MVNPVSVVAILFAVASASAQTTATLSALFPLFEADSSLGGTSTPTIEPYSVVGINPTGTTLAGSCDPDPLTKVPCQVTATFNPSSWEGRQTETSSTDTFTYL